MAPSEATERQPKPTKRQCDVLAFIRAYTAGERHSPTLADIAAGLGIDASTAAEHVAKLAGRALIIRKRFQHRTIQIPRSR